MERSNRSEWEENEMREIRAEKKSIAINNSRLPWFMFILFVRANIYACNQCSPCLEFRFEWDLIEYVLIAWFHEIIGPKLTITMCMKDFILFLCSSRNKMINVHCVNILICVLQYHLRIINSDVNGHGRNAPISNSFFFKQNDNNLMKSLLTLHLRVCKILGEVPCWNRRSKLSQVSVVSLVSSIRPPVITVKIDTYEL